MFVAEWFPELPSRYFENASPSRGRYLEIQVGAESAAIGATVNVDPAGRLERGAAPIYSREASANESYGGGALHRLNVGVGRHGAVDIEVIAPHTGDRAVHRGVATNRTIELAVPGTSH